MKIFGLFQNLWLDCQQNPTMKYFRILKLEKFASKKNWNFSFMLIYFEKKSFISKVLSKCISKFPVIFECLRFLDLLQTKTSWIKMCSPNKFLFLNRSRNYQFRKMFQQRLFHTQKCHFLDFIICTNEEKRKITGFEKLLGFGRSHSFVTRGSVTLSCATTPHPSRFSKS